MTLVNGWVQGETVYLYADTAYHDRDGALLGHAPKMLFGSGEFPFAVAVTSVGPLFGILSAIDNSRPGDLTSLLEAINRALISFHLEHGRTGGAARVTAGLVCPFDGARLFVASTPASCDGIFTPFIPAEVDWTVTGASDGPQALLGREVNLCDPEQCHPVTTAVELAEAMRKRPYSVLGGPARQWIGGRLEMARITSAGVEKFIIADWEGA